MAWCGLIGMPLGHSFSPKLHSMLADYDYSLIPLEEKSLPVFLQTEDFLCTCFHFLNGFLTSNTKR